MFIDRCCDMKDDQNMMKQNYDIPAYDMPNSNMCCPMPMMCPPIYECPQERCCHREIIHEVPQDCQFMLYTKYGMNLHT